MRVKLICALVGSLLGFGLGYVFQLGDPVAIPFPFFLPLDFAAVFAVVAFFAAERMFPILLEVTISFVALGGGTALWHYFAR
jgi:hypothetical protein